jgi:DNA-directed RNA polymerase specialized sigma24 family protein
MSTQKPAGSSAFPSTHWSQIYLASQADQAEGKQALNELLAVYSGPLLTYLKGHFAVSQQDAEDLLQSFMLNRVLEKRLLAKAKEGLGRFRGFICGTLHRFAIDVLRHQNGPTRQPKGGFVSLVWCP